MHIWTQKEALSKAVGTGIIKELIHATNTKKWKCSAIPLGDQWVATLATAVFAYEIQPSVTHLEVNFIEKFLMAQQRGIGTEYFAHEE